MYASLKGASALISGENAMPGKMENFGFWLSQTFASTKAKQTDWPYVPGTYFVSDPHAPVAVCTLGSVDLAPLVAAEPPEGLCITGKVETENIGIEKIIKNVLSNPAIRFLLCVGNEPPKHLTGATMVALFENGIDVEKKIPGSPGMRPMLPNTSVEEVEAFRAQVEPVVMIGCMDVAEIHAKVRELAARAPEIVPTEFRPPATIEEDEAVERIAAVGEDPWKIKLDKAGYFVVNIEDGVILVEHYSYKEKFLHIIEGTEARSIYLTIVRNGWVSKLDHAAYVGKELSKAELSIEHGFKYLQDGG
jgi:tetrahydromethanopterin S-methyltransferase subunit A